MNLESATLVLRTSSLNTAQGDINIGNYNNDVTFSNINIQQVLGSMLTKYKKFKLCLTSVGAATPPTTLTDTNRLLCVNIQGLNWENSGYNIATGNLSSSVIAATIAIGTTQGFSTNFTGETGFIFTRPVANNVSIRIFLTRIQDNTIQQIQYPNSVYCFSIYGIE